MHTQPTTPPRKFRRGIGRPSKLTQETADLILNFVRIGSYVETAVAAAGIHKQTYYDWCKQGAALRERVDKAIASGDKPPKLTPHERRLMDFPDAVLKAQAESELMDLSNIKQASVNNWQASAWRLERKNPEKWGRRDTIRQEVSGPGGEPVRTEVKAEVTTIPGGEEKVNHAYKEKLRRELLAEMESKNEPSSTNPNAG